MKKLIFKIFILAILICSSCAKDNKQLIVHYAHKHKNQPHIALGQLWVESNFDNTKIGKDGEIGIGQIIAKWHLERCGLKNAQQLRKLHTNLNCSMKILREMYEIDYSIFNALCRYNGGENIFSKPKALINAQRYAQKVLAESEKYRESV